MSIIGAGNLAWSLIPALQQGGVQVVQLISRNLQALKRYQKAYAIPRISTDSSWIDPQIDVAILTVPDSAIASVAAPLSQYPIGLIHCSGSVPLDILSPHPQAFSAVLYPLQSFTEGIEADFNSLPIFLETQDESAPALLALGRTLSSTVYWLDSEGRKTLHLGAVWANNFSNLMYQIAGKLLAEKTGLEFSVYLPLLEGHMQKLQRISPQEAQTGPAARGDYNTLKAHLQQLEAYPELQELYQILSSRIESL